jgi:hypothetical protein
MGVSGQRHAPATLPLGKRPQHPGYRRLGRAQDRSGWVWKISPQLGFDPRTDQPVVSRFIDYAISAPFLGYEAYHLHMTISQC